MDSNTSQSSRGIKRRIESDDEETKDFLGTPMSQDGSQLSFLSDTQFTSPVKNHLDFEFWQNSPADDPTLPATISIAALKPGQYSKQSLKFRITLKGEIRQMKNMGKFFSFHVYDQTEIAVVAKAWGLAEKFYSLVQVNGIYSLENFTVKAESKDFPSGTGHEYEIQLEPKSKLVPLESGEDIPAIPFCFVTCAKMWELEKNTKADLFGIVVKIWDLQKTSKGTIKRDIAITDESKRTVTATLWTSVAENFSGTLYSPVAIRNGAISWYMDRLSVNVGYNALLWENPVVDEKEALMEWFKEEMAARGCSTD